MKPTTSLAEAIDQSYIVSGGFSDITGEYRRYCQAHQLPFVAVGQHRDRRSICWLEVDLIGLPYVLDGPSFVAIEEILTRHHAGKVRQSNFSASKRFLQSNRILRDDVADVVAAILAVLAMPGAFAPIPGESYKQTALLPGLETTP